MKKLKKAVLETQETVDNILESVGDNNRLLNMQLRGMRMNMTATLRLIDAAEHVQARLRTARNAVADAIRQKLQHTK